MKICLRYQREKYGVVDIFKHRQTQKAFYGGLMICGSVWVCPVCASKISERRRMELRQVFDIHHSRNGYTTMLTLTFSHTRFDKLKDLLAAFTKALKRFQSGRAYAQLRKELGYIGTIRAFEITYGENGWHPHVHLLILHNNEIDPWDRDDYECRFYDLWAIACESADLKTSRLHGLKLDDADQADQYITKWGEVKSAWGTDSEMTKANIKKGREGSLTPFDFLRICVEDGDLIYESQFKEYASATKGQRQLFWSHGLKKQFEIEEKTDEEIAELKEEPADRLGGLEWKDWKYILQHEYRVKLLELIEEHGYDDALIKIGI
ncbi:protein rep, partial [Paenibacillus castaneae]|uniref:protein rep n=1 Tax=Paenibacillus castaneae TaxID=474957 RepID=UPI001ABA9700